MSATFEISPEKERHDAKIKVIGVGGCGGNAVNYLCERPIAGVRYVSVNTDAQALGNVHDESERMQIGQRLTKGLGTGADPTVGLEAAESDSDRIREMVRGYDMIFIAAGMGKGTGTGASPVVARLAREENVLTVAVVTRPFKHENCDAIADKGLEELERHVDSLIVVPNEKLREVLAEKTEGGRVKTKDAFSAGIDVLYNAVRGISEIITKPGRINVDFNDVRSVMRARGKAVIGSAVAAGDGRAVAAAEEALAAPLMENVDMSKAKNVLVNITVNEDNYYMEERDEIGEIIDQKTPHCADKKIWGVVYDDSMGDDLRVTVIVTGLGAQCPPKYQLQPPSQPAALAKARKDASFVRGRRAEGESKTVPSILREQVN